MKQRDWWKNLDGETKEPSFSETLEERRIPCLTLLYHPDGRRVGERALLPALAAGSSLPLSRLEPGFSRPGRSPAEPLGVHHISRRPVMLVATAQGGVDLLSSGSPTPLIVDGAGVKGKHRLLPEDLERGAVILLGHRVVLVLHFASDAHGSKLPELGLIGRSSAMQRVRREILQVANAGIPVLLRGETGTGKELVARAIHRTGPQHDGPFLAINMGAIPPSLAATELFGAVRGAFTGAEKRRTGYFRRAEGGTLFLDEIGDLPPEIQPLLLRALENGEIQPVGADEPVRVRVRVIAATDSDLEKRVAEGRFREPLLHRLGGYEMRLPALRERREDLGELLFHFLRRELAQSDAADLIDDPGRGPKPWLPARLVARLATHDWPGNVRQLKNLAQRLVVNGRDAEQTFLGGALEDQLGDPACWRPGARRGAYRPPGEVSEAELLAALRANRWHPTDTARQLGVSRASLYVLIDGCPAARKASDLSDEEIRACYDRYEGRLNRMVDSLEVSEEGLKRRLRQLEMPPRQSDGLP